MFFNQLKHTKKNSFSIYVFVDLWLFFPFNVILIRIIYIEIFTNDFKKWLEKI